MGTTNRTALGVGALFLGGLLGGLLGGALFAGGEERAWGEPGERVVVERDAELVEALRALTRELGVREAPAREVDDAPREVVREDGTTAPKDFGALVAAMERLTRALERTPAAGGGGIGLTPLVLPPPGHRDDRLRALLALDNDEASRQFRLWTYQQVLDHFGRPDRIYEGGRWEYELPDDGGTGLLFRFTDGFLTHIDY